MGVRRAGRAASLTAVAALVVGLAACTDTSPPSIQIVDTAVVTPAVTATAPTVPTTTSFAPSR